MQVTKQINTWNRDAFKTQMLQIDKHYDALVRNSLVGPATLLQPPFSPATTITTPENRRRIRSEDATLRLCEPARRAVLGADSFRGRCC
jgi:hypothetical protein